MPASSNSSQQKGIIILIGLVVLIAAVLVGGFLVQKKIREDTFQAGKKVFTEEEKREIIKNAKPVNDNYQLVLIMAESTQFSLKEITAKKGEKVRIGLSTQNNTQHNFVIDELDIRSKTITKGSPATLEFVSEKPGTYEYYSSIGNDRQRGLVGKLTITE